ncbi:MAG: hypothetical protein E5W82_33865 [Mesorhizobium sp.]|nr:MAG: hypothetical protein E5W82_33865 [Mesorhizobium sp.]
MTEDLKGQITREDIENAIAALDQGEPHSFGPSIYYDLLDEGTRYPPKAVVGLAARRALGRALRPDEFSGGEGSWAFRLLRDRGFNIVGKLRDDDIAELPKYDPSRVVWIEDTKTAEHGHGGAGWDFGACLWSPSSGEDGRDIYSLMREPHPDDVTIHCNDGDIVGWSRVAGPFQEVKEAPPEPGPWAGRASYYRIPLSDYRPFRRPLPVSEFIVRNHGALAEEIRSETPKRYLFVLYNGTVRRAQGSYLTRCTSKLYDLIREAVGQEEQGTFDAVTRTWGHSSSVEERIREKLRLACPSEQVLRSALDLLALAIEIADEDRSDAWYLRETEHGLRLMAGRLLAFDLRRSRLRLSVIGPVPDDVLVD